MAIKAKPVTTSIKLTRQCIIPWFQATYELKPGVDLQKLIPFVLHIHGFGEYTNIYELLTQFIHYYCATLC